MSFDNIYNKLCAVFFLEEERLKAKREEAERLLKLSNFDSFLLVEYIRTVAIADYFNAYMLEVLKYLKHFDR